MLPAGVARRAVAETVGLFHRLLDDVGVSGHQLLEAVPRRSFLLHHPLFSGGGEVLVGRAAQIELRPPG